MLKEILKDTKVLKSICFGALVGLLVVGITGRNSFPSNYKMTVINNTDTKIEDVLIKYKTGEDIVNIEKLEPNGTFEYKINTNKIISENAIIMRTENNQGILYDEYIVPYLERGNRGKVIVNINGINENGRYNIEIN